MLVNFVIQAWMAVMLFWLLNATLLLMKAVYQSPMVWCATLAHLLAQLLPTSVMAATQCSVLKTLEHARVMAIGTGLFRPVCLVSHLTAASTDLTCSPCSWSAWLACCSDCPWCCLLGCCCSSHSRGTCTRPLCQETRYTTDQTL